MAMRLFAARCTLVRLFLVEALGAGPEFGTALMAIQAPSSPATSCRFLPNCWAANEDYPSSSLIHSPACMSRSILRGSLSLTGDQSRGLLQCQPGPGVLNCQ